MERTPLEFAMWDADEDHAAWKKQELERARELARWSMHPDRVAPEARDYRPDPPQIG